MGLLRIALSSLGVHGIAGGSSNVFLFDLFFFTPTTVVIDVGSFFSILLSSWGFTEFMFVLPFVRVRQTERYPIKLGETYSQCMD